MLKHSYQLGALDRQHVSGLIIIELYLVSGFRIGPGMKTKAFEMEIQLSRDLLPSSRKEFLP